MFSMITLRGVFVIYANYKGQDSFHLTTVLTNNIQIFSHLFLVTRKNYFPLLLKTKESKKVEENKSITSRCQSLPVKYIILMSLFLQKRQYRQRRCLHFFPSENKHLKCQNLLRPVLLLISVNSLRSLVEFNELENYC